MITRVTISEQQSTGDLIKELRTEKGLSIRELADLAGVNRATVSRWERGQRVPSVDDFKRLMDALGADTAIIQQ